MEDRTGDIEQEEFVLRQKYIDQAMTKAKNPCAENVFTGHWKRLFWYKWANFLLEEILHIMLLFQLYNCKLR